MASGGYDPIVRLWDIPSRMPRTVIQSGPYVWGLVFSPDGRLLASGEGGGRVSLHSLRSRPPAGRLHGLKGWVGSIRVSPDGQTLATASVVPGVPLRKRGRLPAATVGHDYALEYGTDRIEMHVDAIAPGERVVVADDLIATGGTAGAAVKLIEEAGAEVVECCFVIELPELGGRSRLEALGLGPALQHEQGVLGVFGRGLVDEVQ